MPNLMLDAANWSDGSNSPPSQWNGTAYEFLIGGTIDYTGTVAAGDTLDFSALVPIPTMYYSHPLIVYVNGVGQYFEMASAAYDVSIALAEGDTLSIVVMDNQSAYSGDVVLTPPSVPTPVALLPIVRQMTTHRVTRGYDSNVTCYVRNELGKQDLALRTLAVTMRSYQRNCTLAELEASQIEVGLVTFTVPNTLLDSKLTETLYRFDVGADGVPVYEAILEIV